MTAGCRELHFAVLHGQEHVRQEYVRPSTGCNVGTLLTERKAMLRELVVIAGPDAGRRFELEDGQTLTVGRGQASDTKINDPRMSREHCRVQVDGDKAILFDSGSTGGTLVHGERVQRYELRPGDVIQIGESQLRYQLSGGGDEATLGGQQTFGRPRPQPEIVPLPDLVGQSLGPYRLDSIIATGHTGMVFRASDSKKNETVAIKVLTPDPAHQDEQRERFVRAMKTMLDVRHPNIVQLRAAGKTGPYCWAAMEFIDGENLADVIQRIGIEGMLDWREAWRVAVHVARGLEEADRRSIIHRNLTPTNILRRHQDKVCLVGDLMLAKALEGTLALQVTKPGQLIGDVPYMAPERTREGAGVDGRSDLYGLGATLYALLTAKPPFESDSLPELVHMVRETVPQRPREFQMSINELFEDTVLRLIAKDPEERFQSATHLLRELQRIGTYSNVPLD